jgi:hypothetical protein
MLRSCEPLLPHRARKISRNTTADFVLLNAHDRQNAPARVGQENLVGTEHIVNREISSLDLNA